jgi:6-pyruvoyltetrahydropterin/6-carboxytetrahydropterin synthase
MYEVEIVTSFSAAHRLREYKGKCERLHGHNYRIHIIARADRPGPGGMVIDFGELKKAANDALERLDHTFLNEIPPFVETEPSAENIAAVIFDQVADRLADKAHLLHSVSVWESENSRATYITDRA